MCVCVCACVSVRVPWYLHDEVETVKEERSVELCERESKSNTALSLLQPATSTVSVSDGDGVRNRVTPCN